MRYALKEVLITMLIVMIVALIICSPLATIWALNTLFTIGIPYTIHTWLAVLWLHMLLSPAVLQKREK